MSEKIKEALSKLDVKNDNHWTADGLPRLDTVKMLANDPSLTREAVNAAAPGFTRSVAAPQAPTVAVPAAETVTPPPVVETAPAAPQVAAPPVVNVTAPVVTTQVPPAAVQTVVDEVAETVVTATDLLATAKEELAVLAKEKAAIEVAYNAKVRQVDALILASEKEQSGDTNQHAIQAYLAQQVANGQERARRMEALKGIDLNAILPKKAPIDAAMNRRNMRGGSRPVRGS